MTLSIKFVQMKQFDTQGTLMTPLPLRRVWMTNVLTGIIRKRYQFMQDRSLAFRCHGHPWDNTPTCSLHRKLATTELYKTILLLNATTNYFSEK